MQNNPRENNENNFISLLNIIADPMSIVDAKGHVLLVNKAFENATGINKNKIIGIDFLKSNILTAENKKLLFENLKKRLQGLPVHPYEISFTNKNGETRFVEVKATKIIYNGQPADLVIFHDITQRKRNITKIKEYAEKMETLVDEKVKTIKESAEKLREAEKRYHALFSQAPVGILLIDPETAKAVEFNEEAHLQLGYPREEFAKLTINDYEAVETPEETKARIKKILKTGIAEFETKHRSKSGEIRDVINAVQVVELSGKRFLHFITQDITEQKEIEKELKLEREKLEAVTENIGAGLVIIGKDYRVVWANNFVKQYKKGIEGHFCYSKLHNYANVCPDCGVQKIFEDNAAIDAHEFCVSAPGGKHRWIEIVATPIKDKDGTVTAALEFSIDITEKKLLQNKLKEYSEKLEQLVAERTEQLKHTQAKLLKAEKLAAIGELAGMVGHDLRNPLTGIRGAVYYLKTRHGAELGAKGKEMLNAIDKAIVHSNKIVTDLVEYSGKLALELIETTPKALLRKALTAVKVPKRIKIVNVTQAEPRIKVDIDCVLKVFARIISNAIDAMPQAGSLTITSKAVNGNVKFVFKDTGTGMTSETLSKIWTPLFTTKAKGMGFGLPISKRIIDAHGGKISIKSALGKGTIVTVTLPIDPELVGENKETWIFTESPLQMTCPPLEKP